MEPLEDLIERILADPELGLDVAELRELLERAKSEIISYKKTQETIIERNREIRAAEEAEVRKYIEANGFEWQEGKSMVFNVTTAIGLLGGTVEELRKGSKSLDTLMQVIDNAEQLEEGEEALADSSSFLDTMTQIFGPPPPGVVALLTKKEDPEFDEKVGRVVDEVIANPKLCICGEPHRKEIDPNATMQFCDDCESALAESIDPHDGDNF